MIRLSALFFLSVFSSMSGAKALKITWLQSDAPPFFFTNAGEAKGSGLCDFLVDEVIRLTPQFEHTKVTIPQVRIGRYFNTHETVCFPCMIYRESNHPRVTFTHVTAVYPPLTIITDKQSAAKIKRLHGDPVLLKSLLADNQFRYGQSVARKFSKEIQALRESTKPSEKAALNYRASDQARVSGEMIVTGRIDYSIDYPFIKDYFNTSTGRDELVSLTIAGHENKILRGAIGCSTNAPTTELSELLGVINPLLSEQILPSENYQKHQAYWLNPYFADFISVYEREVLKKSPAEKAGPQEN